MATNRFTKIKGTKDFLVVAVACFCIFVWAVVDGWFPTKGTLKKHPQEFAITTFVSGVVQTVPVKAGDEVKGSMPVLVLVSHQYKEAVAATEEAYKEAIETNDKTKIKAKLDQLLKAQENLKHTTVRASDFVLETTHGEDSLHGTVLRVLAEPATAVEAGETMMLIRPTDSFYLFNKALSVLMLVGMMAALFFHRVASK